jgi:hypothetical protein
MDFQIWFEGMILDVSFYGDGFDINYETIEVDCWDSIADKFGATGEYPRVVSSLPGLVEDLAFDPDWSYTMWEIVAEIAADRDEMAYEDEMELRAEIAMGK